MAKIFVLTDIKQGKIKCIMLNSILEKFHYDHVEYDSISQTKTE